jgi:hypothetical protein
MPIVYVHGVAVRNHDGQAPEESGNVLLDHLLQNITWSTVQKKIRRYIAPELSSDPESVSIAEAYWGDLGAKLAWNGSSFTSNKPEKFLPAPGGPALASIRSLFVGDIRAPIDQLVARFMGDVFCYLSNRGNFENPGPIPLRVLTKLSEAQQIKERTGEPIIAVTNSLGCEIMYDIVTHFLPKMPEYNKIKVDYWCGVASQVGLFEELKLFICSSSQYGADHVAMVPFPDRNHLGVWWNVWDSNDLISYSVKGIIDGVDDTPYEVGQPMMQEHIGYLLQDRFYKVLAGRIRTAFAKGDHSATIPEP